MPHPMASNNILSIGALAALSVPDKIISNIREYSNLRDYIRNPFPQLYDINSKSVPPICINDFITVLTNIFNIPTVLIYIITSYLTSKITILLEQNGTNNIIINIYDNKGNKLDRKLFPYNDNFFFNYYNQIYFDIDDVIQHNDIAYLTNDTSNCYMYKFSNSINMHNDHIFSKICVCNNDVYSIGGIYEKNNTFNIIKQVYKLTNANVNNFVNNFEWEKHSIMNYRRFRPGIIVINDIMYVIGGATMYYNQTIGEKIKIFNNSYVGSTMEYYSPKNKKWILCKPKLNIARWCCKTAISKNNFIIVGGYDASAKIDLNTNNKGYMLKSTELFDFEKQKWEIVGDLNGTYKKIQILEINNKIVCFGNSGEFKNNVFIEVFNFEDKQWHLDQKLQKLYGNFKFAFSWNAIY
jgi:hypothetical protein